MKKSAIYPILQTFSRKEVSEFRKFLLSPYFTHRSNLVIVYDAIVKGYPKFKSPIDEERVYKKATGAASFNRFTYATLLSYIAQLAQNFLMQKSIEKNVSECKNHYLDELRKRKLNRIFETQSKNLSRTLFNDKDKFDTIESYDRYRFKSNVFNFEVTNKRLRKLRHINRRADHLIDASGSLTLFFITELCNQYLNIFSDIQDKNLDVAKNIPKQIFESIDISELGIVIKKNSTKGYVFDVYSAMIKMHCHLNDRNFYIDYKKELEKNIKNFGHDELNFHYSNLINYCLINYNMFVDEEFFQKELFGLYKIYLEKEFFRTQLTQYIHPSYFRNIWQTALYFKDYDWMKNFLDKYWVNINPEEAENMYLYGYAVLNYHRGNLKEAKKYSLKVKTDYFMFMYDIKFLQLKIYFEMGDYMSAESYIHNFIRNVSVDRLLTFHKRKSYLTFAKYYIKVLRMKSSNSYKNAVYITSKIKNMKEVVYKNWLYEKSSRMAQQFLSTKEEKNKRLKTA